MQCKLLIKGIQYLIFVPFNLFPFIPLNDTINNLHHSMVNPILYSKGLNVDQITYSKTKKKRKEKPTT